MKKKKTIDKDEIQNLGLGAIKKYFEVPIEKLDKIFLQNLHQRARLAMSFEKEMNVSKRAVERNYLRVFSMVAKDKKELKRYIKRALPEYL